MSAKSTSDVLFADMNVISADAFAYSCVYTFGVSKTVPVRELRADLARVLDDVADRREHIIVTRNGRPAVAIVPIDEYEALEESAEILSDPAALAALEEGLAELARGEVVTLEELRSELSERRRRR